jgi:hypothetical protein
MRKKVTRTGKYEGAKMFLVLMFLADRIFMAGNCTFKRVDS